MGNSGNNITLEKKSFHVSIRNSTKFMDVLSRNRSTYLILHKQRVIHCKSNEGLKVRLFLLTSVETWKESI